MSAPSVDVLRWGRERARTGPWRGEADVAYLSPVPSAPLPSAEFLKRCLEILAARGVARVVTGALSPVEQIGFLAAGFDVAERLHLLGVDLRDLPDVPKGMRLGRGRKDDSEAVLAVDQAAFSSFWQFDRLGLQDALEATPATRWRVALPAGRWGHQRPVAGYAICGRAGTRGFVQRLAVDPGAQRQGIGRRLLLDGMHWMAKRGARGAVVNTQVGNEAALALYLDVGFTEQSSGLSVLAAGLR
jgi:ribosomal protein S18 acetylase RimI-like enzyme